MRYAFVLDQAACIGCHACTVGCKAENDVPLGAFRTWVKWIEHGAFPETRRSAAVLRCNHCEDAPCVGICPTVALHTRPDGIVDLDRDRCIGCASCMQACPYDAIHIDPRHGTAAKCHFCAHRLETGLAPACVSVCPEQAIRVVDLDDAATAGALAARDARVRKPGRATQPRTYYLGVDPAALDPLAVDGTRTLSHAEVPDPLPAPGTAAARAVYDVPRPRPWGERIAAYMATKALAAGALVAAALDLGDPAALGRISLAAVAVTVLVLIGDLHRPRRFHLLLTRPNPRSWLVRGGWVLTGHAALSAAYALGFRHGLLAGLSVPVALLTAVYTAFLFRQARGRELWCEDSLLVWHLAAQAMAAAELFAWWADGTRGPWLAAHFALVLAGAIQRPRTPGARFGHARMLRLPGYRLGVACAALAVLFPPAVLFAFVLLDRAYVRAGQEVPLS